MHGTQLPLLHACTQCENNAMHTYTYTKPLFQYFESTARNTIASSDDPLRVATSTNTVHAPNLDRHLMYEHACHALRVSGDSSIAPVKYTRMQWSSF